MSEDTSPGAAAPHKTARLAEIARMADLLTDILLEDQIMGRPRLEGWHPGPAEGLLPAQRLWTIDPDTAEPDRAGFRRSRSFRAACSA